MKQLIRNHNLDIFFNEKFPSDYPVEIVERKGLGHPDTLADSLAEVISIENIHLNILELFFIIK